MSGMSDDNVIANLKAQAIQQQEALERIAARCGAVNYPPDLVVEIAALARGGQREPVRGPPPAGRPQRQAHV
jgi:hypothetical protein